MVAAVDSTSRTPRAFAEGDFDGVGGIAIQQSQLHPKMHPNLVFAIFIS
jgi:hypothetical protein